MNQIPSRLISELELLQVVLDASKMVGFPIHSKATCVAIEGPRFSSRAEVCEKYLIFIIHNILMHGYNLPWIYIKPIPE